jgi:lysophospholipase L1-like esterase
MIQTWNQEIFNLTLRYPQVTVVPMYDIFWNRTTTYLWNDVFHPNEVGYKQMAIRVAQVLEADLK